MTWTYAFYLAGALYIVGPVIAWILLFHLITRLWYQNDTTPPEARVVIPTGVWVWVFGMLAMLVTLVVGHLDFELGVAKLIKSSIGWAKGWALLAIFPLIGCLPVRTELLYRAAMVVCFHTLLLLPVFIGAYLLRLPETPYISPLRIVGGPGPEFFSFTLYEIDPGNGLPRWRLFTPWAPALGFVANIYFIFALQEKQAKWRWYGFAGSIAMILISKSRLALVALVLVWLVSWGLGRLNRPSLMFSAAGITTTIGMFGVWILEVFEGFVEGFKAARVDSTRVRAALGRIALERWRNEAPVWGHGIVERGPHLVEYMPIGSHHSWYGLLFVKGVVGLVALAVPMIWSFLVLALRAHSSQLARAGVAMVIILFLYTFGENLEILAYLFWPGLVLMGIALKEAVPELPQTGRTLL